MKKFIFNVIIDETSDNYDFKTYFTKTENAGNNINSDLNRIDHNVNSGNNENSKVNGASTNNNNIVKNEKDLSKKN